MTLRVHYLQHSDGEGPGAIDVWADARGYALRGSHPYRGEPMPSRDSFDLMILLGGGMNVGDTDRFAWLPGEKRFIREVIAQGTPVLGICLGSQLLAEALGATVKRNREPEIGWFPVERSGESSPAFARFPERAEVFHWHEQSWELPAGAVCLARSAACGSQAFAYGDRVVGLQFHPEMTLEIARFIAEAEGDALPAGAHVQSPAEMLARPERFAAAHPLLWDVLDHLAGVAAARPEPAQPA
jgi:GMP synthase-like glutamine amidotransferase